MGYSLRSAVADIIDNAISASAQNISIGVEWNAGRPALAITDDGWGMDRNGLIDAMRFGGEGPTVERSASDLGRFGLGMKTASLSQARRVTVVSKRAGLISAFRWDLDHIAAAGGDWELLEGVDEATCPSWGGKLHAVASGTVVIWENIDFGCQTEVPSLAAFEVELTILERHLAMVFHRHLERETAPLRLELCGRAVAPWDPFLLSNDPAPDRIGKDMIRGPGGNVHIVGYVLPHPGRFANAAELERAGGPEGWQAQQGFYVYRGDRLLTHGGWWGLGRGKGWARDEASRLARISIDLPASADFDWQIDVRKSMARPPASIRKRLEILANSVRTRARDVYVHRGPRAVARKADAVALWTLAESPPHYRINRDHPAYRAAESDAAGLSDLVALVEKTLPVERIWLDRSDGSSSVSEPTAEDELVRIAVATVRRRMARGASREEAIETVAKSEPFDTTPGMIERIRASLTI